MTTKKVASRKRTPRKPKVVEHPKSSAAHFINREVGWLNFNRRVLNEAMDLRTPLLERLKFLSISNTNLDEFFMKRVGGLKRQVAFGVTAKSSDGQLPQEQLVKIRQQVLQMVQEQADCFARNLKPELSKNEIYLHSLKDLNAKEKEFARKYFSRNVFPVLTPLSVDPGHPFPFISNLSVSLGVTLKSPDSEEKLFARLKVPKVLPQWIRIESDRPGFHFLSLIDLIRENLAELFPSMQVIGVMPFRITRNADFDREEEDAEDLLRLIEEELRQRRFAEVVRLETGKNPDPWILRFLMEELDLKEDDIYELPEELDYTDLGAITSLHFPKLKYESWSPVVPSAFSDEHELTHIFSAIRSQDHLLHHPYESFSASAEKFIHAASVDPKVLAIKMTLYRTSDNSPFIQSLIRAAESGKQVVCLVELKARFDEQRNIYWAQALENAGVHVVYGIIGLKTHAKTALVVRQEPDGLKSYVHIGTGNYNSVTSRFYTDVGLLTARDEIVSEVVEFFNFLTGRSLKNDYKYLLIAPINMFQRFRQMIDREAEHAKNGRPSHIIAKFNNMEENDISDHLYKASQAGVSIDLIVRGFCCLRPGVAGLSEKIRVMSMVGRFLEHTRIFYFRNGAADPVDGEFYIGSADWMYRNLHARVEAVVPILDRGLREKLWDILQNTLKDQRQSWDMDSSGAYKQRKGNDLGAQQIFMNNARQKTPITEESQS